MTLALAVPFKTSLVMGSFFFYFSQFNRQTLVPTKMRAKSRRLITALSCIVLALTSATITYQT